MYKKVHSTFVYNSPKLEITQISITRKMEKEIVVYSHNKILFNITEQPTDTQSITETKC